MSCWHTALSATPHESVFSMDASSIAFGPGVLSEAGEALVGAGAKRVALFTDERLGKAADARDAAGRR